MRHWVLLIILAVTVAVIAYLTVWVFTGNDEGLEAQEPDGRAVPLPGTRPLTETDITALRFDTTLRGYRMVQVDAALRRAAYDLGYKQELIDVLEAEVQALREGRIPDAEELRRAREGAAGDTSTSTPAKPTAQAWPAVAEADSDGTEPADVDEAAELEATAETVSDAGADADTIGDADVDADAHPQAEARTEAEAETDAQAEAETDADADAVQRAAGRR